MKKHYVLTEENRVALINYRRNRTQETLLEVDALINNGFYNAAMNRLYYACFYIVTALLVKNNITAHTHEGVKQMFSLHYIVTKKLEQKYSTFYSRLLNYRISGDYDDFVQYDKAMLTDIRSQAIEFIQAIEVELT